MKYIAAYALLVLGGNNAPKAADVEKVLKEAGIKSEADHVERLVAAGNKKLASMGSVSAAPAQAKAETATKVKVEEEKPKEEEADVDMGNLFGDDY